jgi:hypothetical protein
MLYSAYYDEALLTPFKDLVQCAAICIFATDFRVVEVYDRRWMTGASCSIAQRHCGRMFDSNVNVVR